MRDCNGKLYGNLKSISVYNNDSTKAYKKFCELYNTKLKNNTHLSKLLEANHQLENVFQEKCYYPLKRKQKTIIEIVDKDNHLAKTRTEQLALPKPRKLIELQKREAFTKFNDVRRNQASKLYQKSLLSVYSRFMKALKEKEPENPKKLNDFTKPQVTEHIKLLAKPKQDFSKLKTKTDAITTAKAPQLQRIKQLSKPKIKRCEVKNKIWTLTKAQKNYQPTKRLCELSKPKMYETIDYEQAFKVQTKALIYKATSRIKQLSKPQRINIKTVENKQNHYFRVNKKALKAKTTERLKELATPKEYSIKHIKANPFSVSKSALKAKASKRIQELAQAKIQKVSF